MRSNYIETMESRTLLSGGAIAMFAQNITLAPGALLPPIAGPAHVLRAGTLARHHLQGWQDRMEYVSEAGLSETGGVVIENFTVLSLSLPVSAGQVSAAPPPELPQEPSPLPKDGQQSAAEEGSLPTPTTTTTKMTLNEPEHAHRPQMEPSQEWIDAMVARAATKVAFRTASQGQGAILLLGEPVPPTEAASPRPLTALATDLLTENPAPSQSVTTEAVGVANAILSVTAPMPLDSGPTSMAMYLSLLRGGERMIIDAARHVATAPPAGVHVAAEQVVSTMTEALAAPQKFYYIAELSSPYLLLGDAIGSFVDQSAEMSMTMRDHQPRRAWVITVAVLSADAVLVSYYFRRGQTIRTTKRAKSPFFTRPTTALVPR